MRKLKIVGATEDYFTSEELSEFGGRVGLCVLHSSLPPFSSTFNDAHALVLLGHTSCMIQYPQIDLIPIHQSINKYIYPTEYDLRVRPSTHSIKYIFALYLAKWNFLDYLRLTSQAKTPPQPDYQQKPRISSTRNQAIKPHQVICREPIFRPLPALKTMQNRSLK